mmetsp:Transcript_23585/g.57818  ORF Transcript_23585/g.57818 Transcript_23585/m.57818 type:complete len:140 (-) Transcript_23585:354-773(-)
MHDHILQILDTKVTTHKQKTKQFIMRAVGHPGSALTMTPWQECVQIIRNLRRRDNKKLQRQKCVLEGQAEEVEFLGTDGKSMYGGTVAKGFLFDYLADKPEPSTTQNPFCILDDDDAFEFVPEVGWDSNWSTRASQLAN